MHDDFEPALDALESLDGATPRQFARVFIAGTDGGESRRDALALASVLAESAEAVTSPERADLVVVGSAPDGLAGRVTLGLAERPLLEGSPSPAAVAPRGFAYAGERALRRIAVGLDGGRGSLEALETAHRLARAHDAGLCLIGVAEIELGDDLPHADPRELTRLSRHLSLASERLAGVEADTELREGIPDRVLIDLSAEADLLVLGSRTTYGGGGQVAVGEVTAHVLRGARCPTLLVPAP
ncbi:MAG: universal stress protein [Actinobacteria bacterium]|nr:universal stress protein [Actinomycetota bacterium]